MKSLPLEEWEDCQNGITMLSLSSPRLFDMWCCVSCEMKQNSICNQANLFSENVQKWAQRFEKEEK